MSEEQRIVCLSHILNKNAAQNSRSASRHSFSDGLVCWTVDVQYVLRIYATEQDIREAVEDLHSLPQGSNGDGNTFSSRAAVATFCSGKVHTEVENIAIIVNGNLPAIPSIVSRFRREQSRNLLTFNRIVSYGRHEGDHYLVGMPPRPQPFESANRTTSPDAHRATTSMNTRSSLRPRNRMVTLLEPTSTKSQEEYGLRHV